MRRLVLWATVCSILLLCSGLALAEGKVVVYSSAPVSMSEGIIRLWYRQHPNIRVELVTAGTGELFTRAQAERFNPQADIMLTGGKEQFESAIHLFQPYKSAEDSAFPPNMKHPQYLYYGISLPLQVFIVNTKLLSLDTAPRSWADLADPKYKGKVIMAHPALSGSAYAQLNIMLQLYGWDFVERVIRNVVVTSSSRLVYQGVADGEYAVGITGEGNVFTLKKQGYPVEAVYPSDGTALRFDAVGIFKGAPNLENARLFLDFVNSKEVHEKIVVAQEERRSARPDVAPPPGLRSTSEIPWMNYDDAEAANDRNGKLQRFEDILGTK